MAFTTITQLVSDLNDITLTGVVKYVANPPEQISTAELPLKFIAFPEAESPITSFSSSKGLQQVSIEIAIVISPVLNNLTATNYLTATQLMDRLETALETNAANLGLDRWTMTLDTIQVGDANYWTVMANLFVSG